MVNVCTILCLKGFFLRILTFICYSNFWFTNWTIRINWYRISSTKSIYLHHYNSSLFILSLNIKAHCKALTLKCPNLHCISSKFKPFSFSKSNTLRNLQVVVIHPRSLTLRPWKVTKTQEESCLPLPRFLQGRAVKLQGWKRRSSGYSK